MTDATITPRLRRWAGIAALALTCALAYAAWATSRIADLNADVLALAGTNERLQSRVSDLEARLDALMEPRSQLLLSSLHDDGSR